MEWDASVQQHDSWSWRGVDSSGYSCLEITCILQLCHLILPRPLCSLSDGICFGYSLFLWIYVLLRSGFTCQSPSKWLDKRDRTFFLQDEGSLLRNFSTYHLISRSHDHRCMTFGCMSSFQLDIRHLCCICFDFPILFISIATVRGQLVYSLTLFYISSLSLAYNSCARVYGGFSSTFASSLWELQLWKTCVLISQAEAEDFELDRYSDFFNASMLNWRSKFTDVWRHGFPT